MPKLYGLSLLIEKIVAKFDRNKRALAFSTKWIDEKYRDGGRITAREYQEFLNELKKIEVK